MTFNDLQKNDFYKSLKKTTELTSNNLGYLDIKSIENRIQQTIGVLNLIEKLGINESQFKNIIIASLKLLYKRKKELQFGYIEKNIHYCV
jgi:hypothetical protein